MYCEIISWLMGLDLTVQIALISSFTTITVLVLKGIFNLVYKRYSFQYKMRKEYDFVQRKSIKEQLAKSKTPLIKASEELNYRLWNLSNYIDEGWHSIPEKEWTDQKRYYLRSFSYRFLSFIFWILKAENSMYKFDLSKADKADQIYLKQIKTLKHFFCERELLEELGYVAGKYSNHFYKDELDSYSNYIKSESECLNYMEFEKKFNTNFKQIHKVIKYLTDIRSDPKNLNYNTIKSFHVFLLLFLNDYGLDYHKTSKKKIKKLVTTKYFDLRIKKGLMKFLERNKVQNESKILIKYFKLQPTSVNISWFAKLRNLFYDFHSYLSSEG